jgi:hypothetical protein
MTGGYRVVIVNGPAGGFEYVTGNEPEAVIALAPVAGNWVRVLLDGGPPWDGQVAYERIGEARDLEHHEVHCFYFLK